MDEIIIDSSDKYFQEKIETIKSFYPGRTFNSYQIEEMLFRMYLCKECFNTGKCPYCGCEPISTMSDLYSCNKNEKFPKLSDNESDWKNYKKQNNITII